MVIYMRKKMFVVLLILIINIGIVFAHEDFNQTKQLIDSGISCNSLTYDQLDAIGDYYMEQMHPGEAHELMHKMMGGENSTAIKQMHIQMAKNVYCNESGGMMGMSGEMMNMMYNQNAPSSMQNMMGNYEYQNTYWIFLNILYIILLIGLIVLVYVAIVRMWKSTNKHNRK